MAARWIPDPKVGGSNPSSFILNIFFGPKNDTKMQKGITAETGNRTQAAAATTRSPATRLFRLAGVAGMEDPGIDPGSQPCEGCMLPCTTIPLVAGVSGFRSQYLVLAKHARFRLRQYP